MLNKHMTNIGLTEESICRVCQEKKKQRYCFNFHFHLSVQELLIVEILYVKLIFSHLLRHHYFSFIVYGFSNTE